jgi:hypothetical protein
MRLCSCRWYSCMFDCYPEVYGAEPGFGIGKLGATGAYPYPKVLAVDCCGIPQVEVVH